MAQRAEYQPFGAGVFDFIQLKTDRIPQLFDLQSAIFMVPPADRISAAASFIIQSDSWIKHKVGRQPWILDNVRAWW
jgi:cytochrome bd-type quinol oxidase subunit 1